MSENADHALSFWLAPVGGALVGLALTFPAECSAPPEFQCTTIFGFPTIVLNQAQSFLIALFVGGVFWLAVKAYESLFKPNR